MLKISLQDAETYADSRDILLLPTRVIISSSVRASQLVDRSLFLKKKLDSDDRTNI